MGILSIFLLVVLAIYLFFLYKDLVKKNNKVIIELKRRINLVGNLAKKVDRYVNNKIKFWHCILAFVLVFVLLFFYSSQKYRPTIVFFGIPFLILFPIAYPLTKSVIKSILISIVLAFLTLFILIAIALSEGH